MLLPGISSWLSRESKLVCDAQEPTCGKSRAGMLRDALDNYCSEQDLPKSMLLLHVRNNAATLLG